MAAAGATKKPTRHTTVKARQ